MTAPVRPARAATGLRLGRPLFLVLMVPGIGCFEDRPTGPPEPDIGMTLSGEWESSTSEWSVSLRLRLESLHIGFPYGPSTHWYYDGSGEAVRRGNGASHHFSITRVTAPRDPGDAFATPLWYVPAQLEDGMPNPDPHAGHAFRFNGRVTSEDRLSGHLVWAAGASPIDSIPLTINRVP